MRSVGVCSWSLRAGSGEELGALALACGVDAVQLALDPLRRAWGVEATRAALDRTGVKILSGMMGMEGEDYTTPGSIHATGGVRVDAHWEANLRAADANASIAALLGVKLVTFHAGFLPADADDPLRRVMVERLRRLAGVFGEQGVRVGLETGQEDAATLLGVLHELRAGGVGVNFDPANMILYGTGDPVAALRMLAEHVVQVHVKDAVRPRKKGEWGQEVPVGTGAVGWPAFSAVLAERAPHADLVIEREAGEQRVEDVRTARALIKRVAGA